MLVAANVAAFAYELSLGAGVEQFVRRWGLVPADVVEGLAAGEPAVVITLLTCTLLHAGWFHLLTNMLYLAVFGPPVERRLGSLGFSIVYAASALAGSLAYLIVQPTSETAAIGASGAIAGIIASHLVLFPGATLGSIAPVLFLRVVETTPTFLLFLLWLAAQLFISVASLTGSTSTLGWAHVGGFAIGLVVASVLRKWRPQSY